MSGWLCYLNSVTAKLTTIFNPTIKRQDDWMQERVHVQNLLVINMISAGLTQRDASRIQSTEKYDG